VDSTEHEVEQPVRNLGLLTFVLAVACGASVANLYYAQPLLDPIARTFHTTDSHASIIITVTQLGYSVGMFFVMPLGDLLENRTLAYRTVLVTAVALTAAALAPNLGFFLACMVLVGLSSVVAQILIPFAAHLAPNEQQRGYLVGRVMSGLLLGILLARTVSSFLAALWGWHSIFFASAGLMLVMAVMLAKMLPSRKPHHTDGYRSLMASVGEIARHEPAVRRRAFAQAMMFGAFTSFWTSIGYELIREHHLSQAEIGVFALVGAAGAAAAPIAGKLADRGLSRIGSGVALALASISMVITALGHANLIVLGAGAVLLDLAVQSHQVFSQKEIYQLRPDARARVNTVFMTSVFLGGAAASAISGALYESHGWGGAAYFGAACPLAGLAMWIGSQALGRSRATRELQPA
jgi:predicted MFS family arabinose efflux permease